MSTAVWFFVFCNNGRRVSVEKRTLAGCAHGTCRLECCGCRPFGRSAAFYDADTNLDMMCLERVTGTHLCQSNFIKSLLLHKIVPSRTQNTTVWRQSENFTKGIQFLRETEARCHQQLSL